VPAFLDVGKREAMSLAQELQADALIIDEPDGREVSKRLGLHMIGMLQSLYDAAEAALCELGEAYNRLQQTTFRAHSQLFRAFLDAHIQSRVSPGSQGG
jgi:predicted nucleic acid-binding protein